MAGLDAPFRRSPIRRSCVVAAASLALLFALGVRVAGAFAFEVTPVFCDGVDDEALVPLVCALPDPDAALKNYLHDPQAAPFSILRSTSAPRPRALLDRSRAAGSPHRRVVRVARGDPGSSRVSADSVDSH